MWPNKVLGVSRIDISEQQNVGEGGLRDLFKDNRGNAESKAKS